ncbi:hypothetical protein [Granulosicoccus antarcticus]|uniref:Uncharacterized protein n=1 Tax=Granulosicoccus antarcticus IMCC3135 TaxID=1192854 RepID=A0A2Z2NZU1_9GAMM|nr:hypothetical protein [Granulosicoccus antarcticus]ASJ76783.1 hypothetical protein IMCC3135_33710 [Granulosicoccus antarcticus IMCC3135]
MFEITDVLIAGVIALLCGVVTYSSIKNNRNNTSTELTDKKKRRQKKLLQKELWEHAAYSSAYGIAMFIFFVFNAAKNLSHYPFWLRLVVSLACFLAVLFVLRLTTHAVFRYFVNRANTAS